MDVTKDIREFLMTRRARIAPEEVGIARGGRRRVPGLRREEVAQLAGVSTEYYTQIERGNIIGVSADVLGAVAKARCASTTTRLPTSPISRVPALMPRASAPSAGLTRSPTGCRLSSTAWRPPLPS